jgi:tRNA-dihydrouridine synthase
MVARSCFDATQCDAVMSATALLRNPYLFDADGAWAECAAAADLFGPGRDVPDRSITAALEYLHFAGAYVPAIATVRDHLRTIFEVRACTHIGVSMWTRTCTCRS